MQAGHQSPSVIQSQSSIGDENDEVALLKNIRSPKPHITRSNSAPQAHNRFGTNRQDVTSKLISNHKLSPSKKRHPSVPADEQNILTLSDGVISVDHKQAAHAAAHVLSSYEHTKAHSPKSNNPDTSSALSSTPLCDTNYSPSSTKHYYQKTFPALGQDTTPEDVWQRRDNLDSPGQVDNNNMSKDLDSVCTDISKLQTGKQVNGVKDNSSSGHFLTNGPHLTAGNGVESETEHVAAEIKDHQSLSIEEDVDWHTVEVRSNADRFVFRQALSEMILPSDMQRKMTLASMKEKGYARLQEELMKAQKALERKDEEVDELRGIRERLMKEVSDFTASLFEEVNSQLNEAAISEQQAKKQLKEANAKIEVLSAEVAALKDLVLTSTPSSPNKHLHPQIDNSAKKDKSGKPFWKTHRRSTSHHQFTKESREKAEANEHHSLLKELDTVAFEEFKRWCLQPTVEFSGQFFTRVQQEDIQPCLNFKNTRLADKLLESVRLNTLSIEPIPGDQSYPRKCCLSESHKLCNYKIKFEGDDEWHSISQMSRNRIAAVCDFYAYLRYIVQGLVKCSEKDMFAELVRLRNQMAQSRLGLI